MQVIEQTHEQKMTMYMKLPKKKLIEMLIQCNLLLDARSPTVEYLSQATVGDNIYEYMREQVFNRNIGYIIDQYANDGWRVVGFNEGDCWFEREKK